MNNSNELAIKKLAPVKHQLDKITRQLSTSKKYSALVSNEIQFISIRLSHLIFQLKENPNPLWLLEEDYEPTIKKNK